MSMGNKWKAFLHGLFWDNIKSINVTRSALWAYITARSIHWLAFNEITANSENAIKQPRLIPWSHSQSDKPAHQSVKLIEHLIIRPYPNARVLSAYRAKYASSIIEIGKIFLKELVTAFFTNAPISSQSNSYCVLHEGVGDGSEMNNDIFSFAASLLSCRADGIGCCAPMSHLQRLCYPFPCHNCVPSQLFRHCGLHFTVLTSPTQFLLRLAVPPQNLPY